MQHQSFVGSLPEWLSLIALVPVAFGAVAWLRMNTSLARFCKRSWGQAKRHSWHRIRFTEGWGYNGPTRYEAGHYSPVPNVRVHFVRFTFYSNKHDPVSSVELDIRQDGMTLTLHADTNNNRWGRASAFMEGKHGFVAVWRLHNYNNRIPLVDLPLSVASGDSTFSMAADCFHARNLLTAVQGTGGRELEIYLSHQEAAALVGEGLPPASVPLGRFETAGLLNSPANCRMQKLLNVLQLHGSQGHQQQ